MPTQCARASRRRTCVQGDQASIVGGAINFVKELEQLLQSLEARRQRSAQRPGTGVGGDDAAPFAGFFTFPQYSMRAAAAPEHATADATTHRDGGAEAEDASGSKPSAVADVEATMVESHANLRVLSRRRPRQLLRLVVGLQGHRLTVLHLNMSSAGQMVLYSFSLKVIQPSSSSISSYATLRIHTALTPRYTALIPGSQYHTWKSGRQVGA
jgi:hypothetical protein